MGRESNRSDVLQLNVTRNDCPVFFEFVLADYRFHRAQAQEASRMTEGNSVCLFPDGSVFTKSLVNR